jgi:hypothetical protein
MYTCLPSTAVSGNMNAAYSTAPSTAPASTLGAAFKHDDRREYTGGTLLRAWPVEHQQSVDLVENAQNSKTGTIPRSHTEKSFHSVLKKLDWLWHIRRLPWFRSGGCAADSQRSYRCRRSGRPCAVGRELSAAGKPPLLCLRAVRGGSVRTGHCGLELAGLSCSKCNRTSWNVQPTGFSQGYQGGAHIVRGWDSPLPDSARSGQHPTSIHLPNPVSAVW